jgi:hypothetical protein
MKTRLLLLALLPFILAGCAETVTGYKRPYDFVSPTVRKNSYKNRNFRKAYDDMVANKQFDEAKMERNQILSELMAIIEAEHGEYERSMLFRKSLWDTVLDFTELGLTGAAAVSGGAQTKAILAAIAAGTKGAEISIDKNVLHDHAVEAIQTQMRATQKLRKAQVIQSMQTNVTAYPLDLGLADIFEFYYDGTIARAFQNMVKDAKDKEEDADDSLADAKGVSRINHRRVNKDQAPRVPGTNAPPTGPVRPPQ